MITSVTEVQKLVEVENWEKMTRMCANVRSDLASYTPPTWQRSRAYSSFVSPFPPAARSLRRVHCSSLCFYARAVARRAAVALRGRGG